MALQISGKLKSATEDQPSFTGCRIEAQFDQQPAQAPTTPSTSRPTGTEITETFTPSESELPSTSALVGGAILGRASAEGPIPARVSALSDAAGNFTLVFPDPREIASEKVKVVVHSAVGRFLKEKELVTATLGPSITIEVQLEPTNLGKPVAPTEPTTRRIRGRVIERTGKQLPASLQVLLLGHEQEVAGDSLVPILVAKADNSGYFSGAIKNLRFDRVVAVVAEIPGDIPVLLENSLVPPRIPILVELPATPGGPSSNDCGCSDKAVPRTPTQDDIADAPGTFAADLGTGQCIRFNVPNRAIEEFNFYSVVRTTEPEISGITTGIIKDEPVTLPSNSLPPRPPLRPPASTPELDLDARIRAALVPLMLTGIQPQWRDVETIMRAEVVKARATPLPSNFFSQFPGWGEGLEWSFEAFHVFNNAKLDEVIKKAVSVGGVGVAMPPPGVAFSAEMQVTATAGTLGGAALSEIVRRGLKRLPQRVPLDRQAPVDWDSTPTFYEATSIAHGHLLHFKQVWYADGYSLGDLLYSLPLAPGQKKVISVVDWERREQTSREEFTSAEEGLQAALSRDRDLSEVVTGTLSESARGGSSNTTVGFGAGKGSAGNGSYQGFNFGGVMGVSGGFGSSDSDAFQVSSRDLSSSSLQSLRDRTLQSASAVRNLRSTIVQTARQGEAVRATTEVVANHNHCHALTIQYFEVLRHFKVTQELADVQECLFVPFPMSEFVRPKVLRWRESLSIYLKRRELAPAFDAARRIETRWSEEFTPVARYADELVSAIFGELTLTILIPLPPFPEKPKPKPGETLEETEAAVRKALIPTEGPLGVFLTIATLGANQLVNATAEAVSDAAKATAQGAQALAESLLNELSAEERYARFQQEVMPAAAAGFVDQLELYALVGASETRLNGADFTLVSDYSPGRPMLVSLRGQIRTPVTRASISALVIKSGVPLPPGCRAIVNSASLRYQTNHFRYNMINDQRVNDDIDLPIVASTGATTPPVPSIPLPPGFPTDWIPVPGMTPIRGGNGAMLFTPLDEWEQRSPRLEDIRLSAELIEHLNANLEYYHHAIWWTMDPNRRYLLLDGYQAPNAGGRSVASVVDNTLIGIIGNSLILQVAPGNRLDPEFKLAEGVTLLEHYDPQSPAPPSRVSLPTRGVFAEAVMGDCNACEEIDDTRFWRWEESPIDEPPALDAAALASRRSESNFGTPTAFPTPLVSIQNAPQAPETAGIKAALDTLAQQSFADITGLAGTQANAAAAFAKAMDTALAFGKEASALAQQAAMTKNIGQTMRAIDKAESENKIDEGDAKQHRNSALGQITGASRQDTEDKAKAQESAAATEAITNIPPEQIESVKTGTTEVKARPSGSSTRQVPVHIILRGFVPSELWLLRIPTTSVEQFIAPLLTQFGDILPDAVVNLVRTTMGELYLKGDKRTFQLVSPESSQYQAEVNFRLNTTTMTATRVEVNRRFADLAQLFSPASTTPDTEAQDWAFKRSDDTVAPIMSREPAPEEGTDIKVDTRKVASDEFVAKFTVKTQSYFPFLDILDQVKAVIPNTDTAIGNFSKYAEALVQAVKAATPTMDASITVHFFRTGTGIECSVTGTHDPFPSLELYVNGETVIRREAQNGPVFNLLTIGGQNNPVQRERKPLTVVRQ